MLKFSRKHFLVIGLAALFLCAMASGAWAKTYTQILVFGDSLSDNGNMQKATENLPDQLAPFKAPKVWSDGDKIWFDFLASPELLNIQNKENMAYGGAATNGHLYLLIAQYYRDLAEKVGTDQATQLREAATQLEGVVSEFMQGGFKCFDGQIENYISTNKVIKKDSLVALWIGGNDLLGHLSRISEYSSIKPAGKWVREAAVEIMTEKKMNQEQFEAFKVTEEGKKAIGDLVTKKTKDFLEAQIIKPFTDSIQKLSKAEARDFLIMNIPDLGKTPQIIETARLQASAKLAAALATAAVEEKSLTDDEKIEIVKNSIHETTEKASKLTAAYNDLMFSELRKLFATLGETHSFTYYNTFATMNQFINAEKPVFSKNTKASYDPETIAKTMLAQYVQETLLDLEMNIIGDDDKSFFALETKHNQATTKMPKTDIKRDSDQKPETNGDIKEFLFWDAIHPTSKAHEMLATDVYKTLTTDAGKYPTPAKVESEIAGGPCFIDSAASQQDAFVLFLGLMIGLVSLMVVYRRNQTKN